MLLGRRLIAAMLGCALLAACGGADSSSDATDSVAEAGPTPTQPNGVATQAEGTGGEDVCRDHFEGQTLTLVHGHSAAGGYNAYAQLIAPYIAEELGASDAVVQREEGAGGIVALNNTWNAEPDGYRIQLVNGPGTAAAIIAGEEGTRFEFTELTTLGGVASAPSILVVAADGPYDTFDEMLNSEETVVFASSGPGSADWVTASLYIDVFDVPGEIVTGFTTDEIVPAMLRGDVTGFTGSLDSRLPSIEAGETVPVLINSDERVDQFPDVPHWFEIQDLQPEEEAALRTFLASRAVGRALFAPPGMSPELVDCMRAAVGRALQGEELQEEAESIDRPIQYRSGEELQELVTESVTDVPELYVDALTGE